MNKENYPGEEEGKLSNSGTKQVQRNSSYQLTTAGNTSLNICKLLVYVYNYNMNGFPTLRRGMIEQHGLQILELHGMVQRIAIQRKE